MATAWIREYQSMGGSGSIPIPDEPGTDKTPVTFTTSARTAIIGAEIKYVGITASADYHYVVGGSTVTADTNALKVSSAAGPYFIGVKPGQYIAFIAAA